MKSSVYFITTFVIIATRSRDVAGDCNVVPIEEWGGSPLKRENDLAKPVRLVVVQHTVSSECTTDAECEEVLRNIREYLEKDLGFDDIGLSFIVGGNGKVYSGAGWKVGAHTIRYNKRAISLSFIGDFRGKLPSPQALQSAQDFLACSLNNKDLDENYSLVGHMQLVRTLSPGAALQNLIKTWPHWRSDVSGI